jgi:hypothetical protein
MTGIRPQAVDRAARILDDFTMDVDGRVIHLLDAPSPGATSSLSIGRWVGTPARSDQLLLTTAAAVAKVFVTRQRDCHDAPDHGAGGAVVVGSATPGGRSCDAETEAEGQDADGGDCGVAVDGGQRHHAEGLEAEDGRYDVSQLESLRSGE